MKWKPTRKNVLLAVLVLGAMAVGVPNALRSRLAYIDNFPRGSDFMAPAFESLKTGDPHILRARLPRVCVSPPRHFDVAVTAYDRNGQEVDSQYDPRFGGSRIVIQMERHWSVLLWYYYLPQDYPDPCLTVIPHGHRLPPGLHHNRNRYLDMRDGGFVTFSVVH